MYSILKLTYAFSYVLILLCCIERNSDCYLEYKYLHKEKDELQPCFSLLFLHMFQLLDFHAPINQQRPQQEKKKLSIDHDFNFLVVRYVQFATSMAAKGVEHILVHDWAIMAALYMVRLVWLPRGTKKSCT